MNYHFLYTADTNYFKLMYLSIYSLLEHNNYPLTIHIIEADFTVEQRKQLESLFRLYENAQLKIYPFKKLSYLIDKYNILKSRGTDIANARLFSGEIIDVSQILYIDADTIITSSLKEVFNKNSSHPIYAVREFFVPDHIKKETDRYFNAGVLFMNYELCHNIDLLKLIIDAKSIPIHFVYPDQDLLNLALKENIGTLPVRYNLSPFIYQMIFKYLRFSKEYLKEHAGSYYNLEELMKEYNNPCIYHLLQYTRARPWIKNNVHPFNAVYEEYAKQAFGSIDKENPNNVIDAICSFSPLIAGLSTIFETSAINRKLNIRAKIKDFIFPNNNM